MEIPRPPLRSFVTVGRKAKRVRLPGARLRLEMCNFAYFCYYSYTFLLFQFISEVTHLN